MLRSVMTTMLVGAATAMPMSDAKPPVSFVLFRGAMRCCCALLLCVRC